MANYRPPTHPFLSTWLLNAPLSWLKKTLKSETLFQSLWQRWWLPPLSMVYAQVPFFFFFLPRAHKSELVINPGRNQNLPLFPLEQTAWLYDLSQALPLRVGGKENMVPLAILFIVSPRFFRASPLQLFFAFSSFVVGVLLAAATRYQVRWYNASW